MCMEDEDKGGPGESKHLEAQSAWKAGQFTESS
jgi:hypothetical protein